MAIPIELQRMQDQLTETGRESLPDAELTFKPMFGGVLGYSHGKPFASLSDVGLALKLAPDAQAELLALPGAKRLRYEPEAPESKTYIVLPPAIIDDPEALAIWMRRSVEFVTSQDKPKRKSKAKG